MFLEFFLIKRKILKSFRHIFRSSDTVLDIGAGSNPYYHRSIEAKIFSMDIIQNKNNDVVGDAMHIPFRKNAFDGIVCVNSIYYYPNPFLAVKEFSNALRKDGKLVLIVPFMYPIHDAPDDKFRFTEYGIRQLLKDDFKILHIKTIGGIFNLPAVFFHSLMKGIPLFLPAAARKIAKIFSIVIFIVPYLMAQLVSILDFLDMTRRWPTYYFVTATKK